ncbi:MAG: isochorismate synthase [Paraprevotella sp.]|nr:isochorismate synthase [Paraprevotella sp.]
MREDEVGESIVSHWVEQGGAFVFYRVPDRTTCVGLRASVHSLKAFGHLAQLDGEKGFVFAPFAPGGRCPVWLLPFGEETSFSMSGVSANEVEAPAHIPLCGDFEECPSQAYREAFGFFSDALRAREFRKLVLSRCRFETCPEDFSWARAFCAACRRYVHSYVYLFHTPQTGYWLGATPEVLLAGSGEDYRTMALAGTQYMADGKLTQEWSAKNVREQQLVTEYICDCLQQHGLCPVMRGPYTATAGELAHLKTDISFALSDSGRLGYLLQALHPTPAVCGLPKQSAFRFISAHEGYDRSYYAGFLGRLEPEGDTALYVNLRCMRWNEGRSDICLYAGGGLLPASVLEEEWTETERKLQTMKYVISKGMPHVFG